MAEKAKMVRMVAPGGATLNFVGVTGNTHVAYPVSETLIKKALERNIKVYAPLTEAGEDGKMEAEVTLENYMATIANAVAVPEDAIIVPDIEKIVADAHAEEAEQWIIEVGKEIKKKQDEMAGVITIEGSGANPVNTPGPNPSF